MDIRHHNLSTSVLDDMEAGAVAELPPDTLNHLQWLVADELVKARSRDNKLHQALETRYAGKASEALLADGRDTGTVHLTDGQFDVTVNRPKRVKWDDTKLRAALDRLDPDTARHFAKVKVEVDERKFAAATPDIQQILAPARTVETGKATYALSQREAA